MFQLIDLYNKTKATFIGLQRIDKRDYPTEALREALLNCIVHRDYSFSASILINVYDDRIECVVKEDKIPYTLNAQPVGDSKDIILKYASENKSFKRKDIENILGLKQTRVYDLLKQLCDEDVLRKVGNGKNSYYELNKT